MLFWDFAPQFSEGSEGGETVETKDAVGDTPDNAPGEGQDSGQPESGPTFSQADVDRIVKERLERERRKAAEEAEKLRKEQEESALVEQEKFRELAVKRQAELEAIKPKVELAKNLSEMLATQLAKEVEAWPDSIKALLPDPGDIMRYMDAVDKARPVVQELQKQNEAPGNRRGPKPVGKAGDSNADEEARQAHARWARRQF